MKVCTPKNTLRRIDQLWAFVSVDPNDSTEGVCAFRQPDGTMLPLVAADEARLVLLRPIAQNIARLSGMKLKLIRLTTREDLEDIEPGERPA